MSINYKTCTNFFFNPNLESKFDEPFSSFLKFFNQYSYREKFSWMMSVTQKFSIDPVKFLLFGRPKFFSLFKPPNPFSNRLNLSLLLALDKQSSTNIFYQFISFGTILTIKLPIFIIVPNPFTVLFILENPNRRRYRKQKERLS